MNPPILIVPGWTNAGPDHWQSIWQRSHPSWIRVEQSDWETPKAQDWLETLDRYVQACTAPPVLVGHSLGCIAIVKWAATSQAEIAGAFLVAPADVESENAPTEIENFAPIPGERLRFPAQIVASRNDEFLSLKRVSDLSEQWGCKVINIGNAGHIATNSGYGKWPEGQLLLANFMQSLSSLDSKVSSRAE